MKAAPKLPGVGKHPTDEMLQARFGAGNRQAQRLAMSWAKLAGKNNVPRAYRHRYVTPLGELALRVLNTGNADAWKDFGTALAELHNHPKGIDPRRLLVATLKAEGGVPLTVPEIQARLAAQGGTIGSRQCRRICNQIDYHYARGKPGRPRGKSGQRKF